MLFNYSVNVNIKTYYDVSLHTMAQNSSNKIKYRLISLHTLITHTPLISFKLKSFVRWTILTGDYKGEEV